MHYHIKTQDLGNGFSLDDDIDFCDCALLALAAFIDFHPQDNGCAKLCNELELPYDPSNNTQLAKWNVQIQTMHQLYAKESQAKFSEVQSKI